MWLTQVCPWNLFLEVSIPFCKTWCKCGEFHVADSAVSLEFVLGDVCTFLQNLVNSEFHVADSDVPSEYKT